MLIVPRFVPVGPSGHEDYAWRCSHWLPNMWPDVSKISSATGRALCQHLVVEYVAAMYVAAVVHFFCLKTRPASALVTAIARCA